MQIYLGLHINAKGQWTSGSMYLNEDDGVILRFDDGTSLAATSTGEIHRFDKDGMEIS